MTECETCSIGEIHACYREPGQKPMTASITSPKEYSPDSIALNGCAVKLAYLIFIFRSISLCCSQPGSGKFLFALDSS